MSPNFTNYNKGHFATYHCLKSFKDNGKSFLYVYEFHVQVRIIHRYFKTCVSKKCFKGHLANSIYLKEKLVFLLPGWRAGSGAALGLHTTRGPLQYCLCHNLLELSISLPAKIFLCVFLLRAFSMYHRTLYCIST